MKVLIVGDQVRLDPPTVRAGKVWFTVDPTTRASHRITLLFGLSDDDIAVLIRGRWPRSTTSTGIGLEGIVDIVRPGRSVAVVISADSEGESPAPPISVAVLEVMATLGLSPSAGP